MTFLPSQIYNPANAIPNFNLGNVPNMGNLYSSVMTELQGYGNAQAAALKQNYKNALGMGKQQLAQSGLAGTSIAPSIGEGYMKQYQLALNNLSQQLTSTQVGYQTQLGQAANQMGLQENMQDQSLALGYDQLAQQQWNRILGQRGGGGCWCCGQPCFLRSGDGVSPRRRRWGRWWIFSTTGARNVYSCWIWKQFRYIPSNRSILRKWKC